ncbi:MAG: helix-hairpin-helix domain-containing protein [Pirellula sp.]|jgi:hypothetical protein
MHPAKVQRDRVKVLTDLPNVGRATEKDLLLLGYSTPAAIRGECPYALHQRLCEVTGVRHDPCVIDVFMSITRFLDGEEPKPWWDYTPERKAALAKAALNAATA